VILTPADLELLTGRTRHSAQRRVLDDCLAAAAADVSAQYGLAGWDLDPRWGDRQRDTILVTVPDHATRGEAA
jgi:hypothetical protein